MTPTSTRILRRTEVETRCGIGRSTIYDWMSKGLFPQPLKLGVKLVRWRESDIEAWLASRAERKG